MTRKQRRNLGVHLILGALVIDSILAIFALNGIIGVVGVVATIIAFVLGLAGAILVLFA